MSRPSRVVLPVLDLEQNDKPIIKKVVKGCKNYTQHRINADSSSNSSCSFSFQPPSQNSIVDRKFILKADISVDLGAGNIFQKNQPVAIGVADASQNFGYEQSEQRISKNDADAVASTGAFPTPAKTASTIADYLCGGLVRIGNNLAPRQFPLSSIIDTIDLTINGTHFTASMNQYIHAVMEYTTPEYRERVFTECAHCPDKNNIDLTAGRLNHPLNLRAETSRLGESPRGTLLDETSGNGTRKLTFHFEEPLFLSPLMAEFGHGMTNINDVSVVINWASDLSRCLSATAQRAVGEQIARTFPIDAAALQTATKTIDKTELNVRYYSAQDDIKIPNEIVLPYKQPKVVINSVDGHNNGTASAYTGNNIRLNQVPEAVFIYVKTKRANQNANHSDTSLRISKVEIDWNNQSGLLSSLSERDLVRVSVENGLDEIGNEYLTNGLVLKLVFGKDIPLPDNVSAGTRGDWSIQINPTIPEDQATAANLEMFQVFFYNGHAIISPNECKVSTGLLDLRDNVEAEDMGDEFHGHQLSGGSSVGGSMVGGSSVGGSFVGGKMNHLVRRLGHGVKTAEKFAPVVMAGAKAYSDYKTRQ